jgi:hypothetical protein
MPSKWQQRAKCRPLIVGYMLGLLFYSEDGGSAFFRNFHRATKRYTPEDSTRQTCQIHQTQRLVSNDSIFDNHRCEIKYNVSDKVYAFAASSPISSGWAPQLEWFVSVLQRTTVLVGQLLWNSAVFADPHNGPLSTRRSRCLLNKSVLR